MDRPPHLGGWKLLAYAVFLGPVFLTLYFWETRRTYPAARYLAWAALLAMGLCTYPLFAFTFSPSLIRIGYGLCFLALFGLLLAYCWVIDSKSRTRIPGLKKGYSFTRAVAWMMVMGILFQGLNNIVQGIYYWVLGEQIAVYFSSGTNVFKFWGLAGAVYGFLYGIREGNDYFNRDLRALSKSIALVFFFIALYSGLVLMIVVYPVQRLAPIAYRPQWSDALFYFLLLVAMVLSAMHLLRAASRSALVKGALLFLVSIPLIALHAVVLSGYAVTINLAVASIMEDRQDLSAAKSIYAKAIPHIRYDHLLASLHHRQGVLHVLNREYAPALASFKKVIADYSEAYDVYRKAKRYVDSFEKGRSMETQPHRVLPVKHQTFEQAASCFPNSLSVILSFYEDRPVSTRKLSYAIKESFAEGAFIWKTESFLRENGYQLNTTFWQDKEMLLSLLDAGYPVLVYMPGHVLTLYGYDARMEMFFTYDTATSNRWNDKPFQDFQREWMRGGFLMSVVVRKGEEPGFAARFPGMVHHSESYSLWQKSQISDYYEQKSKAWKDYDRYLLSESLGLDRLKIGDPYFLSEDFSALPWEAETWKQDVLPLLSQPWATDWRIAERYVIYLLKSGQPKEALHLLQLYQSHRAEEKGGLPPRFMELKLAASLDAGERKEVLSVSDKLIGVADGYDLGTYWGHFCKARALMAAGDRKGAAAILIPALDSLRLNEQKPSRDLRFILDALNEIMRIDPKLIGPREKSVIEVARIHFAAEP